jgi:hypothetical protein
VQFLVRMGPINDTWFIKWFVVMFCPIFCHGSRSHRLTRFKSSNQERANLSTTVYQWVGFAMQLPFHHCVPVSKTTATSVLYELDGNDLSLLGQSIWCVIKKLCFEDSCISSKHNIFNKIIFIVLTTQESSVAPFERTKKRKGQVCDERNWHLSLLGG